MQIHSERKMAMTIQQLKYLVEISKCGSMNKAAKNLFVSQPSISKAIRELENDLGIEIFHRDNTKKLKFTLEGSELLLHAKDLIEQTDSIERIFANKSKLEYFRLIISSQHYAFVVQSFIEFMNSHKASDYELLLREKKTDQIIEDVYTQQSSVGIICLSTSTENFMRKYLLSKNIEFHSLARVNLHAFIRFNHPLAGQESTTLEELSKYPYISYEQEHYSQHFSEEALEIQAKQSIRVLDRATMNNIICHTNAYTIGTGFLIEGIIEQDLISIPIRNINEKLNVGWIKIKNFSLTAEAREFIDLCCKNISQ
jgi:DNA-binding transcriptional LysR family regulator